MNETRNCQNCGATFVPAAATAQMCPRCLLGIGLEPERVVTGAARAPQPAPAVGELQPHFPDLEILELVGQGGMGAVYRARQRDLDRVVALKILQADLEADPTFAERFAREARALASLDHPNVVTIFASGRAGPHYYLLMEFVEGAHLRTLIRQRELSAPQALAVVGQVCDALQYAHGEGVVHRDIKPENILVDARGRVKIADFGLAKMFRRGADDFTLTRTGQSMGTPHYMAPEQIDRPFEVDHRADIYSLGVVFYELLTGELPIGRFMAPSEKVQVDVRLDEVVLKTLAREPQRRYQAAGDLRTDVDRISSGPAPPPPLPPEPPVVPAAPTTAAATGATRRDEHEAPIGRSSGSRRPTLVGCGCITALVLFVVIAGALLLATGTSMTPAETPGPRLEGGSVLVRSSLVPPENWCVIHGGLPQVFGLDHQTVERVNAAGRTHLDEYRAIVLESSSIVSEQMSSNRQTLILQVDAFPSERRRVLSELLATVRAALGTHWRQDLENALQLDQLLDLGAEERVLEISAEEPQGFRVRSGRQTVNLRRLNPLLADLWASWTGPEALRGRPSGTSTSR